MFLFQVWIHKPVLCFLFIEDTTLQGLRFGSKIRHMNLAQEAKCGYLDGVELSNEELQGGEDVLKQKETSGSSQ